MGIVEKPFRRLFAALFALFVFNGMSMTIIGATLPRILADFGWSYTGAGVVIAASAVGFFSANFFAGHLLNRIGTRATILTGLLILITGLMFFATTPSLLINLLLNLAIGVGQGFLELTVNYATIRMEKPGSGRAMNIIHGAFSLGAVTGPLIVGLLMRAALSWAIVYRGIAALFALSALIMPLLPFDRITNDAAEQDNKTKVSLVRHPAYWLGFFSLLLYVGVELGISNWLAEYFVTVFGTAPAQASFLVSLFWGGLLVGRLVVPLVYKGNKNNVLLITSALLMSTTVIGLTIVGFLGNSVFLTIIASILVALAGLGCALIYPVVVTFISTAFPNDQSVAIGFAAMGGGVGSFAFPFIMSYVATRFGIRTGFATYAFFSIICVLACMLLIKAVERKTHDSL